VTEYEKSMELWRSDLPESEFCAMRPSLSRRIVNCLIAPPRNILTYLLTYLLTTSPRILPWRTASSPVRRSNKGTSESQYSRSAAGEHARHHYAGQRTDVANGCRWRSRRTVVLSLTPSASPAFSRRRRAAGLVSSLSISTLRTGQSPEMPTVCTNVADRLTTMDASVYHGSPAIQIVALPLLYFKFKNWDLGMRVRDVSFWLRGILVERRSLINELSLSCAVRSTYSWRVTTYVGKPSVIGQPTRLTQPFILSGSINE